MLQMPPRGFHGGERDAFPAGYTANANAIAPEMGCYILSGCDLRKVTKEDPTGNNLRFPKWGSAQGICSDGKGGCLAIKVDGNLVQISKDFKETLLSDGWCGILGMCTDGSNGCFIISAEKRLWHVTPEYPSLGWSSVYWSSGWGGGPLGIRQWMCPGPSGCYVLNPATGKLWLASEQKKTGKLLSEPWTSWGAKQCSNNSGMCEDGKGGCFVMSGAAKLWHVAAPDANPVEWVGSWWSLGYSLGGICWDGRDGCFVVSGACKLWHVTHGEVREEVAEEWSHDWRTHTGCMASLVTAASLQNVPEARGSIEIVNTTQHEWRCKFYPTDEPSCGVPIKDVISVPGKTDVLRDLPDWAWLRFCNLEGEVLQRSFVASGQRIKIIDGSSQGVTTREGVEISPYWGYTLEFTDTALYDRALQHSSRDANLEVNIEAVAKAAPPVARPEDGREIWLGCERLGDLPIDYEGYFHWGIVVGDPRTSHAFEVTGQGEFGVPMCVVGPNGIVAHSPQLKGEQLSLCKRNGRTLSQYGPGVARDGTFCGGYILLPHKTNRTDKEIEEWTKTWVEDHPTYGIDCHCQTYSHALYVYLVGYRFPYKDDKLDVETAFVTAPRLPHYQSTFQWTCRKHREM